MRRCMENQEEKLYTLMEHKPALFGTAPTGEILISVRAISMEAALEKMKKL